MKKTARKPSYYMNISLVSIQGSAKSRNDEQKVFLPKVLRVADDSGVCAVVINDCHYVLQKD
jgi:hypothetical protein